MGNRSRVVAVALLVVLTILAHSTPTLALLEIIKSAFGIQKAHAATATNAIKFPNRGNLRWNADFVGPLSSGKFKVHKKVIHDAMNTWSALLMEDVTIRVRFSVSTTLAANTLAQTVVGMRGLLVEEVANRLEKKLNFNGYTKITFPKDRRALKSILPPPAGTLPSDYLAITPTIGKILFPAEFSQIFAGETLDAEVQISGAWLNGATVELANTLQPSGKISFYQVIVHELGHALGFISSVDDALKGKEFFPYLLDLYRFRATESNIDFAKTRRFLEASKTVDHMYWDPYPIEGRESKPRFSAGTEGDGNQASHWKDDFEPSRNIRRNFVGVMDPSFSEASIRNGFTLPDLRAFSRMGYRIADNPKPIIYGIWKKQMSSGTYYGVAGQLLTAPVLEFMFESDQKVKHTMTAKSTTYMTASEASRDIGKFLDRRRNLFHAFSTNAATKLPDLKQGATWKLYVRNRTGAKFGLWSDPITLKQRWVQATPAADFSSEMGLPGSSDSKGRGASFGPFPGVKSIQTGVSSATKSSMKRPQIPQKSAANKNFRGKTA